MQRERESERERKGTEHARGGGAGTTSRRQRCIGSQLLVLPYRSHRIKQAKSQVKRGGKRGGRGTGNEMRGGRGQTLPRNSDASRMHARAHGPCTDVMLCVLSSRLPHPAQPPTLRHDSERWTGDAPQKHGSIYQCRIRVRGPERLRPTIKLRTSSQGSKGPFVAISNLRRYCFSLHYKEI